MPHFVVVEDDHLQEGPIADNLAGMFPDAVVETVTTEEQFRAHLPPMREAVPDLVLMDVMLRWASPRPGLPAPPDDVVAGGYYRAGLRCARLMLGDSRLRRCPWCCTRSSSATTSSATGRPCRRTRPTSGRTPSSTSSAGTSARVCATSRSAATAPPRDR